MRIMKQHYFLITIACLCVSVIATNASSQQNRDPFSQYNSWGLPSEGQADTSDDDENPNASKPPLERYPLQSYGVSGIIVSPDNAIAIVKAFNGQEFFVQVGDHMGNEGGTVESIHTDGVTIDTGKTIVNLHVSNNIGTRNE